MYSSCGQKEVEKADVPGKRSETDLINEVERKKSVVPKEREPRKELPFCSLFWSLLESPDPWCPSDDPWIFTLNFFYASVSLKQISITYKQRNLD